MPEYLSPGIYVEEVDAGPKPIEGVGTAMAAFVGFTEKAAGTKNIEGERVTVSVLNEPRLITSWSQYNEEFGGFIQGAYLPQAVYGYFNNGGGRCYVVSVKTIDTAEARLDGSDGKKHLLVRAKEAGHDGLRLRVTIDVPKISTNGSTKKSTPSSSSSKSASSSKSTSSSDKDDKAAKEATPDPAPSPTSLPPFTITVEQKSAVTDKWNVKETLKEVTLVEKEEDGKKQVAVAYKNNKAPKWIDIQAPADPKASLANLWPSKQQQMLSMPAEQLSAPTSKEFRGDVTKRSGMEGLEVLDNVTMLCIPDLMSTPPGKKIDYKMIKGVQQAMIDHCTRMGDRVAILDAPPDLSSQEIREWRLDTAGYDSTYAALYYPWIEVDDPVHDRSLTIPPCGHMAGIWARSDNSRGVHKAPANEVVQGAIGLAYNTTKAEQDTLNPDGVNCIRAFPGRGIRVWGARTLSSDPAWRYINVRRLFNYVEKSIERGTQWIVFEPNDHKLWARVRRDVSAFLRTVWRDGALFGLTPQEAFYVKCDEELNPVESRDLGRLIIEIGLCPVKPAEFVIFRISQWAGPNAEA